MNLLGWLRRKTKAKATKKEFPKLTIEQGHVIRQILETLKVSSSIADAMVRAGDEFSRQDGVPHLLAAEDEVLRILKSSTSREDLISKLSDCYETGTLCH